MQTIKTALTEKHITLGAKMAPFGGFEMPIQYTGVKDEHLAVRNGLCVFDVSHMGEFYVEGPKALNLLQRVCSNAVDKLPVGKAQYNYLPNREGGVVDDLIVYRLEENTYFLVVNAANIKKDCIWIATENESVGAELRNASEATGLLAIQGPKSLSVMQKLTDVNLFELPFYGVQQGTFAGVSNAIIATTGYTGAGGIEVYFPNTSAVSVWEQVLETGAADGIQPIGLAARDTLRLEMGYCLYGHEIDDTTNPYAAGLGWISKPHPSNLAYESLQDQKNTTPEEKLIGFRILDRGIPRAEYTLSNSIQETIGRVTSGTQSQSLNTGIGLGYLKTAYAPIGTQIFVDIRNKQIPAEVVKLPFYKD